MISLLDELRSDHIVIQQILSQLLLLNPEDLLQRDLLIKNLQQEIISHTRAEEIILYKPLRQADFSKRLALHGYKEHLEIETLMHLLQLKNAVHINWKETACRLQESLHLHMQEEETEIFQLAEEFFTSLEIEKMGKDFCLVKSKIKSDGYSNLQEGSVSHQLSQHANNNTYSSQTNR